MNKIDILVEFCTSSRSTLFFVIKCIELAASKHCTCKYLTKYLGYNLNDKLSPHWSCIIGSHYTAKMNFIGVEIIKLLVTIQDIECNMTHKYQVILFKSA